MTQIPEEAAKTDPKKFPEIPDAKIDPLLITAPQKTHFTRGDDKTQGTHKGKEHPSPWAKSCLQLHPKNHMKGSCQRGAKASSEHHSLPLTSASVAGAHSSPWRLSTCQMELQSPGMATDVGFCSHGWWPYELDVEAARKQPPQPSQTQPRAHFGTGGWLLSSGDD